MFESRITNHKYTSGSTSHFCGRVVLFVSCAVFCLLVSSFLCGLGIYYFLLWSVVGNSCAHACVRDKNHNRIQFNDGYAVVATEALIRNCAEPDFSEI